MSDCAERHRNVFRLSSRLVDNPGADQRRQTADRVFRGCLLYTSALTLFWLFFIIAGRDPGALFSRYKVDAEALRNVFFGFLFFAVLWGLIWYGVKSLLLRFLAGFSKEERRSSFSSSRSPYS